jgi:hypothetical protein
VPFVGQSARLGEAHIFAMSKLLSDRIRDLHLRPNAPYPSEIRDAHQLVREWRYERRRLELVRTDPYGDVDPPVVEHAE